MDLLHTIFTDTGAGFVLAALAISAIIDTLIND